MTCVECGIEYPDARAKLGYKTCLDCGEKEADKERQYKYKCSAPLYNKGNYGYIFNFKDAMDAGK